MTRRWVVNASPLISLAKISQIGLIVELCNEAIIPSGVVQEINSGSDDDPAKIWLRNKGNSLIRQVDTVHPLVVAWDLGLGESQVLSWIYQNPGYEAILDDRAAKNAAAALRIPVRGTLGVILLAKREGRVESARVLFEQLVGVGFRVSPEVLAAALQLVGE